jgi:hypothetical protein
MIQIKSLEIYDISKSRLVCRSRVSGFLGAPFTGPTASRSAAGPTADSRDSPAEYADDPARKHSTPAAQG